MSGALSPDVIAAINKVAATPLGRKYDRMARGRYGKSGVALAAKEVIGESGGRRNAVSSAGAKGLTQFMPATRAEVLRKYGVDAYGKPSEAVQAMMQYQLEGGRGVEGYNPGMPSYAQYILNQKLDPATNRALRRAGSTGGVSVQAPGKTDVTIPTTTVPGQSFAPQRQALRDNLFLSGNKLTMQGLLSYKQQADQLQDVPAQKVTGDIQVKRTPGKTLKIDPAASQPTGKGAFDISGPDPSRLKPQLVSFARKVARLAGVPLTGLDGSTHSKYTVNGNVSDHYTGNASDVFTIGGKKYGDPGWQQALIHAGQAALIAAGMPKAQALKQRGGLYNVGGHQVIFNVNGVQYGGNHLNHLHISAH